MMGGIGNQLFQYTFSICCDYPCFLDKSWYLKKECNRDYLLHHLNCKFNDYDEETPHQLILRYEHQENIFDEELLKVNNSYISGYFQSYKYCDKVKERLLEDFKPLDEPKTTRYLKMKDKICNTKSVFISVRRGDYLQLNDVYNILDIDYYKKCIDKVNESFESVNYFVFSDDLKWCREIFKGKNFTFIEPIKYEYRDELGIILMSYCNTASIISNSTYSWWGSYLNQNDIMRYAPSKWFSDNRKTEILPDNWIQI